MSSDEPAMMRISGPIDAYWNDKTYSVSDTERDVLGELSQIPANKKINLHVNSEGGRVALALGIHNALKTVQDRLTVYNSGYMLSSATLIPPPKAKVITPKSSVFMFHRPEMDVSGNVDQMQEGIECLTSHENAMASLYSDRTGKSQKAMRDLMHGPSGAGTWMTGDEAIEQGFADEEGDSDDDDSSAQSRFSIDARIYNQLGAIPERFKDRFLAAGAKKDPQPKQPVTAPAASLSTAKEAGNGGKPAATDKTKTPKTMNKLINTLVAAGFKIPADATEDQVNSAMAELISARTTLTTENADLKGKVEAARKARIEAHVQSKVDAKIIKAELKDKWVNSILACESNQEMLDAMEAPTVTANGKAPRGAAPPPHEPEGGSKSDEDKLAELREKMKTERDPEKISAMAIQARALRGHASLSFAPVKK